MSEWLRGLDAWITREEPSDWDDVPADDDNNNDWELPEWVDDGPPDEDEASSS